MEERPRGRERMHQQRSFEIRDRLSKPFDLSLVERGLGILDVREMGVGALDFETLEAVDQPLDVAGLDSEAVQSRFDLEMNDRGPPPPLRRFRESLGDIAAKQDLPETPG